MVFVDTPLRLGRAQVGSANIASGAVYAPKIATHAVGTGQQGTITLARSFGTIENLSIGSYTVAYGSAGTFAARKMRGRALYLTGSLGAGTIPGGRVSVGTVGPSPRLGTFGAGKTTYGTIGVPRIPQLQSLTGTANSPRLGTFSGAKVTYGSIAPSPRLGTFGAAKTTYGTIGVPRIPQLQSLTGTANSPRLGTFGAAKTTYGTLGVPRIPQLPSLTGTANSPRIGTFGAAKTTYGTLGVPRIPQLQSLTGTANSPRIGTFGGAKVTYGSIAPSPRLGTFGAAKTTYGTFARSSAGAAYGSYGTHAGPVHRGRWGSFSGTVEAPLHIGRMGSFQGTISAHRVSIAAFPGTVRKRFMGTDAQSAAVQYSAVPPRSRFVSITLNLTGGIGGAAGAYLRQQNQGTIAAGRITAIAAATDNGWLNLSGWLLPGHGSYVIGSRGLAPLPSQVIIAWNEWDP